MKRNLNMRILALTISLLLGTLPVVAAERPFALNGNGASTFITDGAGNIIGANVTVSGTATHLGMYTAVGTVQFTPDPNNPGRLLSSATATFTAANGDKLQVTLTGSLNPAAGLDGGPIQVVGGTGPYTWRVSDGALPSGLTLNAATGVISGKPADRGVFIFTVEVKDSASPQHTALRQLKIQVT